MKKAEGIRDAGGLQGWGSVPRMISRRVTVEDSAGSQRNAEERTIPTFTHACIIIAIENERGSLPANR